MRRLLLYLILVGVACAPTVIATKALTPTNSQPTPSPTSSAASSSARALGNQLGAAALGDSEAQVIAKLGRPSRETITHEIGSPRWEYDSGYVIDFSGTDRRVWQILVQGPAVAATAQGDTNSCRQGVRACFD